MRILKFTSLMFFAIFLCSVMFACTTNGGNSDKNEKNTKEVVKILDARDFSDGVAIVRICRFDEVDRFESDYIGGYWALIDTDGKVLFNIDEKGIDAESLMQYENGVALYKNGNEWEVYIYNTLYDKKGQIVASPEITGYDKILSYSDTNDYFIVEKTENSFEGDKYMMGVINNEGDFICELSYTHPILQMMKLYEANLEQTVITHEKGEIFSVEIGRTKNYYNAKTNEITLGYKHVGLGEDFLLYSYDELGGREEISSGRAVERLFDSAALVYELDENGDKKYMLIDYEGNVLIDLTAYDIVGGKYEIKFQPVFYYYNKYLLTLSRNPNGAVYCCLFDENGEFAFDPIRMNDNDSVYPLNKKGFLYRTTRDGEDEYFLYGYDGAVTEPIYFPYAHQDYFYMYEEELQLVYDHENGSYMYVDDDDNVVISASSLKE